MSISSYEVASSGCLRQMGRCAGSAVFSPCRRYRYALSRQLDSTGRGTCAFIMLNPSTADASRDDPTIRRCMGFARGWGYHRLEVRNIFAYRSMNPTQLASAEDPVGESNDRALREASRASDLIICAWGAWRGGWERSRRVLEILGGVDLYCLGATKDGHPRHPLYLPSVTRLQPWPVSPI